MLNRLQIIMIVFCLINNVIEVNSQVIISISYPEDNNVSPDLLWDFGLNNTTPLEYNAIINYELRSKDNAIDLTANSSVFNIKAGNLKISPISLNSNIVYDYSNPENKVIISPKNPLFPGDYVLCIKILQVPDQIVLGSNCIEFKVSPPDTIKNVSKKNSNLKRKLNLNLSGNSEVYGYHSNNNIDSFYSPSDILTWTFNPEIEAFGLPVGMNMILTNDKNPLIKSANAVNFYFDAEKYIDNLRNRGIKSINNGERASPNKCWIFFISTIIIINIY